MSPDDDIPSQPLCRVVCAAIRHQKSGVIITGSRHYSPVMRAVILCICEGVEEARAQGWYDCEQGFVDQKDEFLTREQAWRVAEAAGQIRGKDGKGHSPGTLYSEDLY